jgi:hypothetical protein
LPCHLAAKRPKLPCLVRPLRAKAGFPRNGNYDLSVRALSGRVHEIPIYGTRYNNVQRNHLPGHPGGATRRVQLRYFSHYLRFCWQDNVLLADAL